MTVVTNQNFSGLSVGPNRNNGGSY